MPVELVRYPGLPRPVADDVLKPNDTLLPVRMPLTHFSTARHSDKHEGSGA